MIEVVDKSDVVIVRFKDDVRVDVLQGVDGSVYFGEASLPSMLLNIFFFFPGDRAQISYSICRRYDTKHNNIQHNI
jgi:hypothetical protein